MKHSTSLLQANSKVSFQKGSSIFGKICTGFALIALLVGSIEITWSRGHMSRGVRELVMCLTIRWPLGVLEAFSTGHLRKIFLHRDMFQIKLEIHFKLELGQQKNEKT
jgi:hypothetical protein